MSEQYVRERKSNAQKQFAYNKLKNEKHLSLKHEHHKSSASPPKRPPQPKFGNFDKKDKEGMLIDLTSPQQQDNNIIPPLLSNNTFSSAFASKLNDMSILDAPIDVPTQSYPDDDLNAVDLFECSRPEPPPYQSPPTYMNTYGLTKPSSSGKYASGASIVQSQQYGNIDPFDTSHIITTQQQQQQQKHSSGMSLNSYSSDDNSRLDSSFVRNQIQTASCLDLGLIGRPRPTANSDIDDIVQSKMASLSPKVTRNSIAVPPSALNTELINQLNHSADDSCLKTSGNSTLSDSLKVNLSSLTLNDTHEEIEPQAAAIASNPKLDRAFLAELEKEIYKNDHSTLNVNVNKTQSNEFPSINPKENSVNSLSSSLNWLKNDFPSNNGGSSGGGGGAGGAGASSGTSIGQIYQPKNVSQNSPAKYNNTESIKLTNAEQATAGPNMTFSKKLYNTDITGANGGIYATSLNQMSVNNGMASTMNGTNQAVYSNYAMTNNTVVSHEQKYNFSTTANFASGTNSNGVNSTGIKQMNNVYSVASDIYSSEAGVYDVVASSNSDYYQVIQTNESQPVFYDEVADDDLRPHRPAPGVPLLSQQQIQRRMERANKDIYDNVGQSIYANNGISNASGNQFYEEINPKLNIEPIAADQHSKDAVNAINSGTIKNVKIEQLLR